MMIMQYSAWQTFRFKRRRFLALISQDGNTHIYDQQFGNYGSWLSVASFKRHFAKDGEGLRLG